MERQEFMRVQRDVIASICSASLLMLLSGCATSIHRVDKIDKQESEVIFVDAKQRAVLTSERPITRTVKIGNNETETFVTKYRTYCTEPSPDVFSVLSQALSGSGSFGRDTSSLNVALKAAFSSTESGATIPRTQTILMLREMMYRTCERYMSGALSDLEFPIQAVRDQHLMVSILGIEQLTGVVTPRTVALTGTAAATAGQGSSEAVVRLDDAWKELQKADATQKTAKSDYQKLEDTDPKCSAIKAKIDAGTAASTLGDAEQKKWSDCTTQQSKVDDAETNRKNAAEHYETLKTTSANGGPVSSTTNGSAVIGADSSRPDAASIKAVADIVNTIIGRNFDQDEFELFCIRALAVDNEKLSGKCLEYIESKVAHLKETLDNDTARVHLDTMKLTKASEEIQKANQTAFDKFWPSVVSSDDVNVADASKLQTRIDTLIKTKNPTRVWLNRLNAMRKMTKKADILQTFGTLDPDLQNALAAQ